MNDRQQDVLKKLEQFRIDDETPGRPNLTFAQRLARENRWSVAYAERVIHEYKRFIFLACFAGHPVTPSDQVDQCWHLHMTYTRSYWDRLCGGILGKPLHHDPTRGGDNEDAKFTDWYARTKGTYHLTFGEEPPRDIWPTSAERFDPRQRWVRVNAARHWLMPRMRLSVAAGLFALIAGATLAAGCAARPWASGPTTIVLVVIATVISALALLGWALRNTPKRGSGDSTGCTGFWWFGGCGSSGSGDHDGHGGHGGDSSDGGGSGCGSSGCGGGGCGGGGD